MPSRPAASTSRSTATTCGSSARARSSRPTSRPAASTAGSSCSSTTCCSPAARSAPRSTRSPTSAARAPSSSRSSSTGATASCRSAPTTSARTSRPRWSRRVHVLLTEDDGRDAVLLGPADRRGRGRPVKRHLLSRRRPDPRRRDARPRHRRGARPGLAGAPRSRSCRPCAAAPSSTCSSRTRPAPARRFELAAKRLSADVINFSAKGSSVSKGETLKDTALTLEAMGSDAVVCRHSWSGAPANLSPLGPRLGRQRRRRHPRAPDAGAARRLHDAPAPRPGRGPAGHDRRRRPAQPGRALQRPAAAHPRRRGHPRRAADAAAGRRRAPGRRRCRTTSTRCCPSPTS